MVIMRSRVLAVLVMLASLVALGSEVEAGKKKKRKPAYPDPPVSGQFQITATEKKHDTCRDKTSADFPRAQKFSLSQSEEQFVLTFSESSPYAGALTGKIDGDRQFFALRRDEYTNNANAYSFFLMYVIKGRVSEDRQKIEGSIVTLSGVSGEEPDCEVKFTIVAELVK